MSTYQLDDHKLLYHLEAVAAWRRGQGHPLAFSIGPTRSCNYRCQFCAYAYLERRPIFLDLQRVVRLAQDAAPRGAKSFFFSGDGEPLLHRELPECIVAVKRCGVDVALNTNGSRLTPEVSRQILPCLSWIRVSVNAGERRLYAGLHGTAASGYDRVLDNLAEAVAEKRRAGAECTIGVQALILRDNLASLPVLAAELRKIGVDYLALKPFLPHPSIDYRDQIAYDAPEVQEALRQLEALAGDGFAVIVRWRSLAKLPRRDYQRCLSLPFFVDIDSNGDVYPCGPMIGNPRFCYGNLYEEAWPAIWQGERRKNLEKYMAEQFDCSACMPNCRNDAVNRFLWRLRHPPAHVNFI